MLTRLTCALPRYEEAEAMCETAVETLKLAGGARGEDNPNVATALCLQASLSLILSISSELHAHCQGDCSSTLLSCHGRRVHLSHMPCLLAAFRQAPCASCAHRFPAQANGMPPHPDEYISYCICTCMHCLLHQALAWVSRRRCSCA